jgi:hypothetical protein
MLLSATVSPLQIPQIAAAAATARASHGAPHLKSNTAQKTETPGAVVEVAKPKDKRNAFGLTEEEKEAVVELKKRDAEVRRHEQAHAAAGGQHAGAPSYKYTTGPDGQQYATGGEVSIDTAAVPGDPKATIDKMAQVKRAALAPGEPSPQDRAVAAQADATRAKAQAELNKQRSQDLQGGGEVEEGASNLALNHSDRQRGVAAYKEQEIIGVNFGGGAPKQSWPKIVSIAI